MKHYQIFNQATKENSENSDNRERAEVFIDELFLSMKEKRDEYQLLYGIKYLMVEKITSLLDLVSWEEEQNLSFFAGPLFPVCMDLVRKTLFWEYHLFQEQKEDRSKTFFQCTQESEFWFLLFKKYPVLFEQIKEHFNFWEIQVKEVLERLQKDYLLLEKIFGEGKSLGVLKRVQGNLSDRHNQGRSVFILEFSAGPKIVYKPRSVKVDAVFQEYLNWLQGKKVFPRVRTFTVIDKETYGWCEYVEFKPCSSSKEVQQYYHNFGGLLAVLYSMGAVDFHHENLIVQGNFPVLIDLESILTPGLNYIESKEEQDPKKDALGQYIIQNSVMATTMLPTKLWGIQGQAGVDVGAVSAKAHQLIPEKKEVLKLQEEGGIAFHREELFTSPGQNLPIFQEQIQEAPLYREEVVKGFKKVYLFLWQNGPEVLWEMTPLKQLQGCFVRVILRPSQTYAKLLKESFHPRFFQEKKERENFFSWLALDGNTHLALSAALPFEYQSLQKLDIPLFTTQVNSKDLYWENQLIAQDVFDSSPLENIYHRLKIKMSLEDLERQIWFIRSSLKLCLPSAGAVRPKKEGKFHFRYGLRSDDLDLAFSHLEKRMTLLGALGKKEAIWLGVQTHEGIPGLGHLNASLGQGLGGILLGLDLLKNATYFFHAKEKRHELDQKYSFTLLSYLKQIKQEESFKSWGLGNGLGGIFYTLSALAPFTGRDQCLALLKKGLIQKFFGSCSPYPADLWSLWGSANFSVGDGFLGLLFGLLTYLERFYDNELEEILQKIMEQFLALLEEDPSLEEKMIEQLRDKDLSLPQFFLQGEGGLYLILSLLQKRKGGDSEFGRGERTFLKMLKKMSRNGYYGHFLGELFVANTSFLEIKDARFKVPFLLREIKRELKIKVYDNDAYNEFGLAALLDLLISLSDLLKKKGEKAERNEEDRNREEKWREEIKELKEMVSGHLIHNVLRRKVQFASPGAVETPNFFEGLAGLVFVLARLRFPKIPGLLY